MLDARCWFNSPRAASAAHVQSRKMKRLLTLTSLLSMLLSLGCATRKEIVNLKADAAYLRAQVDSLRVEQQHLGAAIRRLQTPIEQSAEAANRLRAELHLQVNQLSEQLQVLSDRLEDTSRRISNLPAKLRLAVPVVSQPKADSLANSAVDTSRTNIRSGLEEAQRVYDAAYQDMLKGRYQLAQQGFLQYLRLMPESEYADNAQYWIGESYYAQQKFELALQAFGEVMAKYPDGDKVPAALLKLAYCQLALGQTAAGKQSLEDLISRFPAASEAKLARSRLQDVRR